MEDDTSAQAKAFKELGMSMQEVEKAVPLELFMKLTKVLEDGNLSGSKFAAMTRILGRDFTSLTIAAKAGLAGKVEEAITHAPSDVELEKIKETSKGMREAKVAGKEIAEKVTFKVFDILDSFTAAVADVFVNGPFIKGQGAPLSPSQLERGRKAFFSGGAAAPKLTTSETQERQLQEQQDKAAEDAKERRERVKFLEKRAEALEEEAKGFTAVSPDKFARMGLYLTGGTQKLSGELVGLNRQSVAELKAIKSELKSLKAGIDSPFD